MSIKYIDFANLAQKEWTKKAVTGFISLCENDKRVKSIKKEDTRDSLNRVLFDCNANLENGENLKGIFTGGKIAGLLHCSSFQADKNAQRNVQDLEKSKKIEEGRIKYKRNLVLNLLKKYNVTIDDIVRAIDKLIVGRRFYTKREERAVKAIMWNQKKGRRDWTIFWEFKNNTLERG